VAVILAVARAELGGIVGPLVRAPAPRTAEPVRQTEQITGQSPGTMTCRLVRQTVCSAWRPDRRLLWTMFGEGSVLGLQQVVAGLMVLLLYLRAAGAGGVMSAALSLTHAGVYPLLFAFAWGSSQAVGAAAAQAVGRGDARELARVTRLGL